jgi:hypothetical protein
MAKRKPILLVDESEDSLKALDLFKSLDIEYVQYDIKRFEESRCGDLPTTKSPSLFAVEAIIKCLEKIKEYLSLRKNGDSSIQSESEYW